MADKALGISGRIAATFLKSEITPLITLVAFLLGLFAIVVTPREEEPQINVTFANVFIPFPGASTAEVERLITTPAEQVLSEIEGIKHVYSVSRTGMSVLTIRFHVGEDRTAAIVRLYNKVFSNQDWFPAALGVGQPIVKPKGIDDVPIVTVTLWSEDTTIGAYELSQVAHSLEAELKRVPGTRDIYTVGAPEQVVHVLLDPQRLAGYGIGLHELTRSLDESNVSIDSGAIVTNNQALLVKAGTFLVDADEVAELVVGLHDGKPVYLADVATVSHAPYQPEQYVQFGQPSPEQAGKRHPAVTIAIAKKPGTNAVEIADRVIQRFEQLDGIIIPEGIETTVTRNYGATADAKARQLIKKLLFATASVVLLVMLTMGWREATIVGVAVLATLAATLFASWAWGFTLNRVSLFALIFSIGILVDDAIVVVENIHRHLKLGISNLAEAIPVAVDEVGGPTILATFTVIAALLPMAFVTGLMGPYMSPIPINASAGMLISLVVAFVVTPWLTFRMLGKQAHAPTDAGNAEPHSNGALYRLFKTVMGPFLLTGARGRVRRWGLGLVIVLLIVGSVALVVNQSVVLKMLPFDNKSEVQVVVDMPEGTSLEKTNYVLTRLADEVASIPEVANYQTYAGTASPIGFNGLVRQYYLRQEPHLGDIQINLLDKEQRDRSSHDVARDIRQRITPVASSLGANTKVVEVPPGPPVLAPLVAEIYGPDYEGQLRTARHLRQLFESTPDIVDVDDTVEAPARRLVVKVDRQRAAQLGISQKTVAETVATLIKGADVSYLRDTHLKYAVPIRLEFSVADKADIQNLLAFKIRSTNDTMVPLSEIAEIQTEPRDSAIHHKDLLPVTYVTGDMSGSLDSPLYGMRDLSARIAQYQSESGVPLSQHFIDQPDNPYLYGMKWDGEWQVTYETFRDMGIAYAVGIVLIYLLVVAQFRSYIVPLIIMAPIPLTLIGVMPGHAIMGTEFTATSMIGMIALAGIIVRNSILLVDFINEQWRSGMPLEEAVVQSGAVRAKPITLTALAAMMGAFFILDDPIFNGLAVSLIFGILVSTLLTLIVIPLLYFAVRSRGADPIAPQ